MRKFNSRGSMTVEAAIVLSLYMLAVIAIISFMEIIKCYEDVEINLYKSARELALLSSGKDVIESIDDNILTDLAYTVLSDMYAEDTMCKQLTNDGQSVNVIVGKEDGISFWLSKVAFRDNTFSGGDDIIDLVATYEAEPLCNIFGVKPYRMANRCRVHAWTGYSGKGDIESDGSERIVYITDNASVYHLTKSCTYLSLSISAINSSSLENSRNSSGAKYKVCEKCGDAYKSDCLFITNEGDKYHSSLSCPGLKRSINAVPLSSVSGMNACSRCGG